MADDVEQFLESVPDEQRRADARRLAALMSEITGEPPVMWGSAIVAFGRYRARNEAGRESDNALAAFSPRKQHLVVYAMGDSDPAVLERLGPHSTGKGCLYVKRLGDVDGDALRELIDRSVRAKRGSAAHGRPA